MLQLGHIFLAFVLTYLGQMTLQGLHAGLSRTRVRAGRIPIGRAEYDKVQHTVWGRRSSQLTALHSEFEDVAWHQPALAD